MLFPNVRRFVKLIRYLLLEPNSSVNVAYFLFLSFCFQTLKASILFVTYRKKQILVRQEEEFALFVLCVKDNELLLLHLPTKQKIL